MSNGIEDVVKYDSLSVADRHIDFAGTSGFHYTEGETAYSNGDLLRAALRTLKISLEFDTAKKLPFNFTTVGEEKLKLPVPCNRVVIPISASNSTEFKFNEASGCYSYLKDDTQITDALNTAGVEYANVFILLADSVTYESALGSELVMKTNERGRGYYLTNDSCTEIKWVTEGSSMMFYDEDDNKLTINRGNSYIAFVKSTQEHFIKFTH